MKFSDTDKRLLELLQHDFPLVSQPFQVFGEQCGLAETEVLEKTNRFIDKNIIREISGIFELRKLKYKSSLVAAQIRQEGIDEVVRKINEHPGVGHNYLRNNAFNVWFTLTVPPEKSLAEERRKLLQNDWVEKYMELPTVKTYKINAVFNMTGRKLKERPKNGEQEPDSDTYSVDKALIRELQKQVLIVSRPFAVMAQNLGIAEEKLFDKINNLKKSGVLRRIAGVLRHRRVGFSANAMVCWKVDENKIDETGQFMAGFPEVTHCYRRKTYDFWNYPLYTMIHGRSKEQTGDIIRTIIEKTGVTDHLVLYSTKEFKKERIKYFLE